MDIPKALMRHLGHMDCGVYAEVVSNGDVTQGDAVAIEAPVMV